jgi:hypothetical protein
MSGRGIDPWITAYHRKRVGKTPDQAFVDYKTQFDDDPELLNLARMELGGLQSMADHFGQHFKNRDYNQYIRYEALREMLAQYDEEAPR